jgi:hypothetical protein
VEEATGDAGPWPPLPPDCPPTEAGTRAGVFYRLIRGDDEDWKTHAMRGITRPERVSQCRWQALSVFEDLEDAERTIRKVGRLKKHRPMAFLMDETMGDLHKDGPTSHHDWWPSATFTPPPASLTTPQTRVSP